MSGGFCTMRSRSMRPQPCRPSALAWLRRPAAVSTASTCVCAPALPPFGRRYRTLKGRGVARNCASLADRLSSSACAAASRPRAWPILRVLLKMPSQSVGNGTVTICTPWRWSKAVWCRAFQRREASTTWGCRCSTSSAVASLAGNCRAWAAREKRCASWLWRDSDRICCGAARLSARVSAQMLVDISVGSAPAPTAMGRPAHSASSRACSGGSIRSPRPPAPSRRTGRHAGCRRSR